MRQLALLAPVLLLAAAPASPLTPGKWEAQVTILDLQMATPMPGVREALMGTPATFQTCLTAAEAARGPRAAMSADSSCQFQNYTMANGRFSARMTCSRPNGSQVITSAGTYTATSYTGLGSAVQGGAMPMTMKIRVSGRRIGTCPG